MLCTVNIFIFIPNRVDRTHKLFVAGKQKRPDANYSRTILNKDGRIIGQVGDGNRKDIRDAVEAAAGALSGLVSVANQFLKRFLSSCFVNSDFVFYMTLFAACMLFQSKPVLDYYARLWHGILKSICSMKISTNG